MKRRCVISRETRFWKAIATDEPVRVIVFMMNVYCLLISYPAIFVPNADNGRMLVECFQLCVCDIVALVNFLSECNVETVAARYREK